MKKTGEKRSKISRKIQQYKRKFYINLILKGGLLLLGLVSAAFLLVNFLEFTLRFSTAVRTVIFFTFLVLLISGFYYLVFDPFFRLINNQKGISNEIAAIKIGSFFPQVKDKLLNLLQLKKQESSTNQLVAASIAQKEIHLINIPFEDSVDYKSNFKLLKYVVPPILLIITLSLTTPRLFTESTHRLVQYNQEFIPVAPFNFVIQNSDLLAFKNENFTVSVKLEGALIPEYVYLTSNDRKIKMSSLEAGIFHYTFQKIQTDKKFEFEGSGFKSSNYHLKVVTRPDLKGFNVHLNYPAYLSREGERLSNVGNLEIPEGTNVKWQFSTIEAQDMSIRFSVSNAEVKLQSTDDQLFNFEKRFLITQNYSIRLKNQYSENKARIFYTINVIPDKFPDLNVNIYQDTVLYSFLALAGNLSDDHGLTKFRLFYNVEKEDDNKKEESIFNQIEIPLSGRQSNQTFFHHWELKDFDLQEGDKINYYLQIWDNDGVNGAKSSKTGVYVFKIPTKKEMKEDLEKSSQNAENKIDETLKNAEELQKKIEEAQKKLLGKKKLDWQDEKLFKELLEKREELNKALEELREQNKANNLKRERFDEQSEKIREKVEQLQKLMDELLDEETKKLYEELQRLLDEMSQSEDFQNLLDEINKKEENLVKELERTIELFKRMKFEFKLEETIDELNELSKEQEELSEETSDKKSEFDDLHEKQEDLKEKFDEFEESLDELNELNQDLENPEFMEDNSQEKSDINQEQQKSLENLENKKRSKAQQNQKNASDKMKQLSKKLQQMQSNMEMMMMEENLDHLRDIVHNLLKLSFDQEQLMKDFREINQSDPRFIELSQKQLKLKDDAKIVEDSLLSLAKRVFQIASFVTREVSEMNNHMDESIKILRDRGRNVIPLTTGKQQFAMTSMNNLALLLNDVMSQMQMQMADAMGNPRKGKHSDQNMPNLSELQKQLNDKIQQLKESGKSGRELSQELAKLAAEQERIRRALQELEEKLDQEQGNGSKNGLVDKMEETEVDLVNKQITKETIKRQREILTRLLEAEDALREREQEEKREAETAKPYENVIPKAFEEYLKIKEKEIELLKTVPPKLYPYYKKEVSDYFKRIGGR